MPGIRFVDRGGTGVALKRPYALGNSLTYRAGDLVVLTTAVTTDPTLRLLATADATALYETAGNDAVGILGVMDDYIATSSAGYANAGASAVSVAAGVAPNYPMPSRATSFPTDANARSRSDIIVIDSQTVLGGTLLETTTVNEDLIGTEVGLDMTVTSTVTAFKWSTAAATKVGTIVGINTTDRLYNVSGGGGEVFVKLSSAYRQWDTGRNYAT